MLIDKIHHDMIAAKKNGGQIEKNLLPVLYSEANSVGKNKRNAQSTDEEVISVIKKFIANIEQTIKNLEELHRDISYQHNELAILKKYLPKQLTENELYSIIKEMLMNIDAKDKKSLGIIMSELKSKYNGLYNSENAIAIIKENIK